ncbi:MULTISPECIES: cation transporter [Nitrincola]|uniref:Cation transporter n=1 Tax=Nitrincola iocasae TaxID=2614693 RepID=A0A5J6L911_9GAMM|nr:cation transporter [Nitrincola iocasae]QEW05094.1 cation transporter [Nitrincola iocasae]
MSHNEHRLGVSEVNLVTRHLGLLKPIDSTKLNAAIVEIDQLYGLDNVAFDEESGRLDFSYDASRLCIDCVEEILTKYGIQPRHGLWAHFKEEYYRFVDQNIKNNARHEPWSCHRTNSHTRK